MKRKKICLLGVSLSSGNLGVAALAAGTVSSVHKCFPEAEVFVLDYSRAPGIHQVHCRESVVSVELVNLRFSKTIYLRNNIARLLITAFLGRFLPASFRQRWLERNSYLKAILDANMVTSLAGGDSFSDIYGFSRLLYVSLPQILVLQLGKPLILLPQTLGPFRGFFARKIANYILRRATVVYSRDEESIAEVRAMVGPAAQHFQTCCDMAFAMEPRVTDKDRLEELRVLGLRRPLVGLNVSGLLYVGGYNQDNMFGLHANYPDLVRAIIRLFIKKGVNLVLVSHVFSQDSEGDPNACAAIYQEMSPECEGRLHLLTGAYDAQEIKYTIGYCDFFLGSRMHACIAALSQCVPTVGLAYSRKFRGVFRSIQVEDSVIDLSELDAATVLHRIEAAYGNKDQTRNHLEIAIPKAKNSIQQMFTGFASESNA